MEPKKPEIIQENPTRIVARERKPTDNVALNVVSVKKYRSRFSLRLEYPDTWPVVLQFLLWPKKLGFEHSFPFRVVLVLAMAFFTVQLMLDGYDAWISQFLHNLNLPVHESGHIVFGIFGNRLLTSLGGSLFQIIMPLVFCFALWIKPRDILGASVALWWAFENFIDVGVYVADALPMKLHLINGVTGAESPYGFHDWNFILSETGLLVKYETVANIVYGIGYVGMCLCVLWGGWSLFYYWFYQRE